MALAGRLARTNRLKGKTTAMHFPWGQRAGVMGVINQVNVKYQASSNTIKSDIEAAIKRQAKLDEEAIKVDVNGSEVTLSGKVHSYFERNYMANSAWSAPGVQKVINNLIVSY